jgi:hypothetical protein
VCAGRYREREKVRTNMGIDNAHNTFGVLRVTGKGKRAHDKWAAIWNPNYYSEFMKIGGVNRAGAKVIESIVKGGCDTFEDVRVDLGTPSIRLTETLRVLEQGKLVVRE